MPSTPDPNANRFIALCDALGQSHDAAAGRRADLEKEILRHLPGLVKDRPVLRAGILNSGSLRIARATKACTAPRDWARFVPHLHAMPVLSGPHLDHALLAYLCDIGLGPTVALALPPVLIAQDDPILVSFALRGGGTSVYTTLFSALFAIPGPSAPIRSLAQPVSDTLAQATAAPDGERALQRVLRVALSRGDRRLTSAVLSRGLDFSTHNIFSPDHRLQDLVARSGSAHGRLWLQKSEPNLPGLLARASDQSFHGLGPATT